MDVKNLVERLGGEEAVRKMAAFQLQNQLSVFTPESPSPPAHGPILIFARRIQLLPKNSSPRKDSSNSRH